MASLAMRAFLTVACFCQVAASAMRWRELLLEQAHKRILSWHTDPNLVEKPISRNGITVTMLKQDMQCGGNLVPVTFAEFDIEDARPIDVFNTMLDTPKQKQWNQQCGGVVPLGDWHNRGARAWAVTFNVPMVSSREFYQWQVADANFDKEEFWLAFSTQNNEELHSKSPLLYGAVDSQNCLGAYHITKGPKGAHVVITQQVNAHPGFLFPLHLFLQFFPPAWQSTLDFVEQMSENSRLLAKTGSALNATVAPLFMLREAWPKPTLVATPAVAALRLVAQDDGVAQQAEAFSKIDPTSPKVQPMTSPLRLASIFLVIPSCVLGVAFVGFRTGRYAGNKFASLLRRDSAEVIETDSMASLESQDFLE